MESIFVSIIVPVYNTEQFLSQCLESLVNQTLKNIEIICVNDGSTDNSLNVINEYASKDSRIVVINKENTGYGNTMNLGLSSARGEYIGIVESDDFASTEMFEKLYEVAISNNVEVVKSNYNSYKNVEFYYNEFTEVLKDSTYNYKFCPLDQQEIFNVQGCIWSGIYKKEFLISNEIWFNETPGASYQDISFNIKVWSCAKNVYLIKDAFLNYRTDNINSSVKSPEKVFCVCDEFEEVRKFLDIRTDKREKISSVVIHLKYKIYLETYNRLASSFQYAFLIRMSKELKLDYEKGDLNKLYWDSREWEVINTILNYPDKYFKDTAKDYIDSRVAMFSTLNSKFYLNGFFEGIDKYEHVIIFGAGVIGKTVAKGLMEKKRDISCFAVSDLSKNPEELYGVPIKSIYNLKEHIENSIILIAIKQREQYDILTMLKGLNIKNMVCIDSLLLKELSSRN